jgi:hypothetical protein
VYLHKPGEPSRDTIANRGRQDNSDWEAPNDREYAIQNHHARMMAEILIATSYNFILGGEGVAKPNQCRLHRNVVRGLVSEACRQHSCTSSQPAP